MDDGTRGAPGNLDNLLELYLATEISIETEGELRPAINSPMVQGGVVHVLTAWNPGAARPGRDANDEANQALYQELVAMGLTPIRARGSDPHSDHLEESWAVKGLTDHEAQTLGAKYGQIAVFRLGRDFQHVIACSGGKRASRKLQSTNNPED